MTSDSSQESFTDYSLVNFFQYKLFTKVKQHAAILATLFFQDGISLILQSIGQMKVPYSL